VVRERGSEGSLAVVPELIASVTAEAATDPARPQRPEMLVVDDLAFRYGSVATLTGLTLSVGQGEFVSLLGPSGCGKTTLLRIIAGLLRPSRGRVYLDGQDVTQLPPERRPLNMVFQHLALFPHLSVGQNVAFGLALQKRPKDEIGRRVSNLLELVGLGGFQERSTHQLSGGQQQRVALARALITEPKILLLDEPLGALDFTIRRELQTELKSLQRRLNITFVFVTHDQTEAMAMSDRVVLMKDGEILQDASPFETYRNPSSAFAAGFVGETTLLEGRVLSQEREEAVIQLGVGVELAARTDAPVGANVVVSVRPEHVLIASASAQAGLIGEIVSETFLGAEVVVQVATEAGLVSVREPARHESLGREGKQVRLLIDPDHIRVFELDEET
jgi:spermidine/putrescine ABC transporter ATP-binding subunit